METEFTVKDDRLIKADNCAGKIEIPSGIKHIDESAFRARNKITEIVLPDGVESIGAGAFAQCKALTRIYIPKSVKKIDENAFAGCAAITVYCETEPAESWIDKTEKRISYYETEEDYAFNFHRGMASKTAVEETIHKCWNPDSRPVITNVPRDKFDSE